MAGITSTQHFRPSIFPFSPFLVLSSLLSYTFLPFPCLSLPIFSLISSSPLSSRLVSCRLLSCPSLPSPIFPSPIVSSPVSFDSIFLLPPKQHTHPQTSPLKKHSSLRSRCPSVRQYLTAYSESSLLCYIVSPRTQNSSLRNLSNRVSEIV